jgi:hypothetical protein
MHVPNRLGRQGEELVIFRFSTGSLGMASPADVNREPAPAIEGRSFWTKVKEFLNPTLPPPVPAVCIPPGPRLALHDMPARLRKELNVMANEEVTFTQIGAAANSFRDAIRFWHGRTVLLQELEPGQRVEVLDLSMAEEPRTGVVELSESVLRRG